MQATVPVVHLGQETGGQLGSAIAGPDQATLRLASVQQGEKSPLTPKPTMLGVGLCTTFLSRRDTFKLQRYRVTTRYAPEGQR